MVIDNGSTDNSIKNIENYFPQIELLKLNKNYGFSGGMNKGIEYLKKNPPDYVIFMNNDVIVSDDFIDGLIEGINSKGENHIYSPVINHFNDKEKIWYGGGKVNLSCGFISHENIRKISNEIKMDKIKLTDYISGCCMLISWSLINRLKGFDERFNMYSEDVDLCIRAQEYNAKCFVVKKSIIWHKVSKSIGGNYSFKKNIRKFLSILRLINIHNNLVFKITGIIGLVLIIIFSIPKYFLKR